MNWTMHGVLGSGMLLGAAIALAACVGTEPTITGANDAGGTRDSSPVVDSGVPVDSSSGADSTVSGESSPGLDSSVPVDSSTDTGGTVMDTGTTVTDTGSATDTGSTVTDSGQPEGSAGGDTLTVMNFLAWCSVTINAGTASTSGTITAQVPAGSVATIVATPASAAFAIGTDPWFDVDQNAGGAAPGTDQGTGVTETTTAKVTVTKNGQCVSVCCGDAPNGSNCPTTNPCP